MLLVATVVALVVVCPSATFAQDPAVGPRLGPAPRSIRVFRLLYREPTEAFAVIQPLLSEGGSITVAPRQGVVTVRDDQAHLTLVAEAIRQFDIAPRLFQVQVTFFRATGSIDDGDPAQPAPVQLRGLGQRLSDLLKYTSYDKIDELVVTAEEGGPVSARIGNSYHVDFRLDGDPGSRGKLRLRNFQVNRVRQGDDGTEQLSHVFRTSVNLKLDQPFVLGATRDEQSRTALLIVLLAQGWTGIPRRSGSDHG